MTSQRDPGQLTLRGRLKFVGRDTLIYGAASTLSKSVWLIIFPLLSRHFSVEDFGLIDLFTVLTMVITTLVIMGQDSAVMRFYYDEASDAGRRRLVTQSLTFQLAIAAVALPLMWVLIGIWANAFSYADQTKAVANVVLLTVPFAVLLGNTQAVLRFTFRRREFLIVSIGQAVFVMIAVLFGVRVMDIGMLGLFRVYLITTAVFAIIGVWFVRDILMMPRGLKVPVKVLYYAVPMGLVVSIGSIQPLVERLVVGDTLGANNLGLYAAGAKVAMLMALPLGAFQTAFGPFLMATYTRPDAIDTFNVLLKASLTLLCVTSVGLGASGSLLVGILGGERYVGGAVVVFPLALALVLQAVGLFLGMGTILSHKTHYRLATYLGSSLCGLIAMLLLGRQFGLVGVGFGALIGQGVKLLSEAYVGQRLWPMKWDYSGIAPMLLATAALGHLVSLSNATPGVRIFSTLAAMAFLCVAALRYWTNSEERRLAWNAALGHWGRKGSR